MKKIIILILAALTLASALASCAPARDRLDSAISLASSEAVDRAKWLDERLEDFPTDVIVGVGSNEAYGIDMTDFEDDGYIVRTIGDDTLVFGASDAGLDRAVRKYAKAAEAGTAENLDETYHEGYRIEKLTIAGNDISEYSVYLPADRNASVDFAAEELVRLVNEACGTTLTVKEGTPGGKYFTFSILDDDSINDAGYKYKVENGNVIIEGKDDFGCPNAVYRFLQNECGWEDLCYGDSILAEAEHVDVKDGASFVGNPRFNYFLPSWTLEGKVKTDRSPFSEEQCGYGLISGKNYGGRIVHACHGMWNNGFMPMTLIKQPCYLDEWMYEDIYELMVEHIEAKLAAGQQIGKEFKYVDIAQPDVSKYCVCSDCAKMLKKENGAHVAGILLFANRIDNELPEEYEGLKFLIFAYLGAQKPCVTPPNDDVWVTYCTDHLCSNHTIASDECTESVYMGITNQLQREWLTKWCEITPYLYVWHYGLDNGLGTNNHIDVLYDDLLFMDEIGVYGVYMEFEHMGYSPGRAQNLLGYAINWDREMTEEEYRAEYYRILEKEYGDGWEYVLKYMNMWIEGENQGGCWHCWHYVDMVTEQNPQYVSENFDEMYDTVKKAIPMANSRSQEEFCLHLLALVIFQGANCMYFDAYDKNDTETLDMLEERWAEMIANYEKINVVPEAVSGIVTNGVLRTCEEHAWTNWVELRESFTTHGGEMRPAPKKYQ